MACAALGILALIGVAASILLPVLVITGGAGLLLSAGALRQLNQVRLKALDISPTARLVAGMAVSSAAATQLLAGLAALTLGVLGLVVAHPYPSALSETGLLVLGASATVSGTSLAGKFLTGLRHT